MTLKGQGRAPNMLRAQYFGNGNEALMGNGHLGIEWSRDRLRHVILNGQRRDPDMFGVQYLENGWR